MDTEVNENSSSNSDKTVGLLGQVMKEAGGTVYREGMFRQGTIIQPHNEGSIDVFWLILAIILLIMVLKQLISL